MHVLGPLRRVRLLVQGLHNVHGARAEAAADGVHEYHDQVAVRGHVEDDLGERGGGRDDFNVIFEKVLITLVFITGVFIAGVRAEMGEMERWRDMERWERWRDGEIEKACNPQPTAD